MKITLIGGTGFVGSHLAPKLLAQGHEVTVTGRGDREPPFQDPNLSFAKVSSSDGVSIVKAIKEADAVINCVGVNREVKGNTFDMAHITGTNNLLSAARQTGLKRLIHISFLRARAHMESPYHMTKWHAEEAIRKSDLDFTILKPGVIYGEGDQFLTNLKRTLNSFPFFGLVGFGSKPISPVYIDDLCEVILKCLDAEATFGKTYEVVGPEELTLSKVVDRTAQTIDLIPNKIPLPVFFHRIAALAMEKLMDPPLLTAAQVTMLSETLSEGTPECEKLPEEMRPQTPFLQA